MYAERTHKRVREINVLRHTHTHITRTEKTLGRLCLICWHNICEHTHTHKRMGHSIRLVSASVLHTHIHTSIRYMYAACDTHIHSHTTNMPRWRWIAHINIILSRHLSRSRLFSRRTWRIWRAPRTPSAPVHPARNIVCVCHRHTDERALSRTNTRRTHTNSHAHMAFDMQHDGSPSSRRCQRACFGGRYDLGTHLTAGCCFYLQLKSFVRNVLVGVQANEHTHKHTAFCTKNTSQITDECSIYTQQTMFYN